MIKFAKKISRFAYFRSVTREERLGYIDRIRDAALSGEEQAKAAYLVAKEEIGKRRLDFLKIFTFVLIIVGVVGLVACIVTTKTLLDIYSNSDIEQSSNKVLHTVYNFVFFLVGRLIPVTLLICYLFGIKRKRIEAKEYSLHYIFLTLYIVAIVSFNVYTLFSSFKQFDGSNFGDEAWK